MNLPNHVNNTLRKEVKPFEKYMRKMLLEDGYVPAKTLAALTVQFHNIYENQIEEILKNNADAGFFKDIWKGVKRGFNSVVGVVESVGNAIGSIGKGIGGMAGGMAAAAPTTQAPPQEKTSLNPLIILGVAGLGLFLILKK